MNTPTGTTVAAALRVEAVGSPVGDGFRVLDADREVGYVGSRP